MEIFGVAAKSTLKKKRRKVCDWVADRVREQLFTKKKQYVRRKGLNRGGKGIKKKEKEGSGRGSKRRIGASKTLSTKERKSR